MASVVSMDYIYFLNWAYLILRTVTAIIWCRLQFVDIERTTVANLYICTLLTTGVLSPIAVTRTALIITETHFPRYHPVLNRRMTSLKWSLIWSITIAGRRRISATCGQLFACYKSVPSLRKIVIALCLPWPKTIISCRVIYGPVSLTFRLISTYKLNEINK